MHLPFWQSILVGPPLIRLDICILSEQRAWECINQNEEYSNNLRNMTVGAKMQPLHLAVQPSSMSTYQSGYCASMCFAYWKKHCSSMVLSLLWSTLTSATSANELSYMWECVLVWHGSEQPMPAWIENSHSPWLHSTTPGPIKVSNIASHFCQRSNRNDTAIAIEVFLIWIVRMV